MKTGTNDSRYGIDGQSVGQHQLNLDRSINVPGQKEKTDNFLIEDSIDRQRMHQHIIDN